MDGNDLEDRGKSSGVGNKDLLDDALESVSGNGNWGKSEGTGLCWEQGWGTLNVGGKAKYVGTDASWWVDVGRRTWNVFA